jgi:hypothetical protein
MMVFMRRRHSLLPVLLVVAVLALVAPVPPASAESAIHPENRPTPIAGEENGRVRPEALMAVEGSCSVARAAAPSLTRMLAAARADGVRLLPDDCYRPYQAQGSAYQRNCAAGNCACAAPAGGSMHGWGKAVDFDDAGGTLRFTSAGYRWMKTHAARYGWNHPRWAEPGGSECPEAWHWEWVGDGGRMGLDPVRADAGPLFAHPGGEGYWSAAALGAVTARGGARHHGGGEGLVKRFVVGGAATATGNGYWLAAADGGVFSFGDAAFHGSLGGTRLNSPVVGMAATSTGNGYWLVSADGGVFAFGDAPFLGSLGGTRLNSPVVGMAAGAGRGYWLVARDGGVFAFGDAGFLGSTGGIRLNSRIVGMAVRRAGDGYWLVACDGGVFAFGSAPFRGSAAGRDARAPDIVGMAAHPSGKGYWVHGADGSVLPFGEAEFHGHG